MSAQPYTRQDLDRAYRDLGVGPGRVIYVTSDMGHLMAFEKPGKAAVLEAHFDALMDLIGPEGTLVVPTASISLCNTDIPFDPETTPSEKVGVVSEFVRTREGAMRSFHPFVSYAAVGAKAAEITQDASRHVYGPETPEGRMAEMDALSISIGLYPQYSCSTVHHVEQMMAVPYRYTKEYLHPVVREGKIVREPFYQFVRYLDSDVERSYLKNIIPRFDTEGGLERADVGRGVIYSYSMAALVDAVRGMIMEDMYVWCAKPPEIRPWQR